MHLLWISLGFTTTPVIYEPGAQLKLAGFSRSSGRDTVGACFYRALSRYAARSAILPEMPGVLDLQT